MAKFQKLIDQQNQLVGVIQNERNDAICLFLNFKPAKNLLPHPVMRMTRLFEAHLLIPTVQLCDPDYHSPAPFQTLPHRFVPEL